MIIQLSWNQVLEWTSKSVQDSYTLNDFKTNFRKHFLCRNYAPINVKPAGGGGEAGPGVGI